MNSIYKPRSSDEALAEQISLARAGSGTQPPATPTYRQISVGLELIIVRSLIDGNLVGMLLQLKVVTQKEN